MGCVAPVPKGLGEDQDLATRGIGAIHGEGFAIPAVDLEEIEFDVGSLAGQHK